MHLVLGFGYVQITAVYIVRFTVDCTDITWSHLLNDIMCILVSPSVTSVCVFYHVRQLCFIIKSIVIHITDYFFTPTNKMQLWFYSTLLTV